MSGPREPDRWNEVGQDSWPPSLEERLNDRDMTPGADEWLGFPVVVDSRIPDDKVFVVVPREDKAA